MWDAALQRYDKWPFWLRYVTLAAWTGLAVLLGILFSSEFYLILGVWGFFTYLFLFVRIESRRRRRLRERGSTDSGD
jgi:hypothetical protein